MSNSKYEYIWNFLRTNDCNEAENISDDVKCVICKRILVNPYIGFCGCRYCLQCITEYLNTEQRFCPGSGNDCLEEPMHIPSTVHCDYAMNLIISKLVVKCPRDLCEFRGELRNLQEHERLCEKQVVSCPYRNIGCQEDQLISTAINRHFLKENESHSKLLMECIGMLQNEMGSIKNKFDEVKEEIREIRAENEEQQRKVLQQEGEIEYLKHYSEELKEENRSIKEDNIFLKSEVEKIRKEYSGLMASMKQELSEIQTQGQKQNRKMEQLSDNYHFSEARLGEFERQAGNEKEEIRRNMDEVREKQAKCDDVAMRVWEMGINVAKREKGEFVWRIDEWSAKKKSARDGIEEQIYSDAFYSHENGYKMCLSVWPDDSYLYVGWHLMRGPFDCKLSWPFKGTVTLSLIDQHTRNNFVSRTETSDEFPDWVEWKKPTCDRNNSAISIGALINQDVLSRTPALCRGDRIFLKCVVKPA